MLQKMASYFRWRVKANRWAAKAVHTLTDLPSRLSEQTVASPPSPLFDMLAADGYGKLPSRIDVPEIDLAPYAGKAKGKAFIDIAADHQDAVEEAFVKLLADDDIAAMIHGYFDGRPWLWNVALNYSEPSDGLTDSQLWHFDYGDVRQLHLLAYFSDVSEASGPFTFLKVADSKRVTRHPLIIERMTDEELARRFDIDAQGAQVRLTGERGDVFVCDPGRLMHQGARCTATRLVMFATFTSRAPMAKGQKATMKRDFRDRLADTYRRTCPDGLLAPRAFN